MTQLAVRLDEPSTLALERLAKRSGRGRSQLVRDALISFEREDLLARMRAESLAIQNDSAERDNSESVLADMVSRRAW